ncbi:unnamed protein product [Protopolystoma xenopodis]|uniref:Uncharacterized protein n=1 Tax=Protopolystoma xenopodis TaxID=117903 RepID=A0A3S5BLL2_9PLAT|nr:unnamed protein product [Protopolystoma xenopodis]
MSLCVCRRLSPNTFTRNGSERNNQNQCLLVLNLAAKEPSIAVLDYAIIEEFEQMMHISMPMHMHTPGSANLLLPRRRTSTGLSMSNPGMVMPFLLRMSFVTGQPGAEAKSAESLYVGLSNLTSETLPGWIGFEPGKPHLSSRAFPCCSF